MEDKRVAAKQAEASAVAAQPMIPQSTEELPDPETVEVRAVLLASEEREISPAAVQLAARIARRCRAPVHVFSIARIWGTTFGFPSPGLYPSKKEWDTQRANVDKAVSALQRKGIEADGRVVGTRAGAKRIIREARRLELRRDRDGRRPAAPSPASPISYGPRSRIASAAGRTCRSTWCTSS